MGWSKKSIYMIAGLVAVSMTLTAAMASGHLSFVVDNSKSEDNEMKAAITANADISKDGSQGGFGYGILTDAGLDAILVATTHAGVKDSEKQGGNNDPEWHTHYVSLRDAQGEDGSGLCPGLEVADIAFEAPENVGENLGRDLATDQAELDGPKVFSSHSLTGNTIDFVAGDDIGSIVSFTIDPVDAAGETITDVADLVPVCINDVNPVTP